MNEVSCRVLQAIFRAAERRGLVMQELAAETGYSVTHLQDGRQYISWSAFCALNRALARVVTPDDLIELGRAYLRSRLLRPFTLVARLFLTARDCYRWAYSPTSPINGIISCVRPNYIEREKGSLLIFLEIPPEYEPNEQFFLISQGVISEVPCLLGLPPAEVTLRREGNRGVYDVKYPVAGGWLSWIWRIFTLPVSLFEAGRELKEANEVLRQRYLELQDARDRLEQRVAERTAQLEQSLRELTEANRQRTEFFANASHELRTPLTLIVAPLEAIAADPAASERTREQANIALRGCYRLLKLVNDLLDIHKIEAGGMRLQMGQVDLPHLLKEAARPFLPILSRRHVELALELPPSLPVIGDPERLEQIALNLISNAAKHTPDDGRIRIGAASRADWAEFFVENTGEGIDPADLPRLFDRFAQSLRSRTRRFGTTGLGLPLVRELVELHGGAIEVDNVPNERVCFRVRLPTGGFASELPTPAQVLKPSELEMRQYEMMASREGGDVVVREPSFGKPRLLLAEDNADMRAFIARCLERDYELIEAADGEQALKLAREALPELVLSDVMMPGLDGIELCRALKADTATAGIPVVLLTARADLGQKLAGLDGGADDYLVKPFHPEELKARLRAQLRIRELATVVARQEKLAALGTLVAGVAHEVRSPLNAVLNSVQALKDHLPPSSPALMEICDLAVSGCKRLDRITSALLRQARAGEGERTDVDVAANLSLALQLLKHKWSAGPKVETDVPAEEALTVFGEPGALNQVWVNLLDNAIYAAGPDGRVQVRAGRDGESVWVEISDSGPGIDPKHLKRIFDPFFTTKPIGQGTGLGLSLVRRFVEEHGGQVRVDSRPGEGTRFRVVLPASTMHRRAAHA